MLNTTVARVQAVSRGLDEEGAGEAGGGLG